MKKVTNSHNQEYYLDETSKRSKTDGDEYKIQNRTGYWVKILKDTSREKQLEIEKQIRNGGGGYETPCEIVSSRGRFTGYTFAREETPPPRENENNPPAPAPERKRRSGAGADGIFLALVPIAAALLVSIMQLMLIYPALSGFIVSHMASEVQPLALLLEGRGFTGIAGGVVLLIVGVKFFPKENSILYFILEAIMFLAGVLGVGFAVMGLAVGLITVFKLFIVLLPVIIIVVILILFIKIRFGGRRSGRRGRR